MNAQQQIPFATQRVIFLALLLGMTMYAIVAAVVLQTNDGQGIADPAIEVLDPLSLYLGAATGAMALLLRVVLHRRAVGLPAGRQRAGAMFAARLAPLAMLEAGCLFAITVWLLNGSAVPSLATAMVLLSVAIAIVPFREPEAD